MRNFRPAHRDIETWFAWVRLGFEGGTFLLALPAGDG